VEEWVIPRITTSNLLIVNTDHGETEHLTPSSLGNISWVQKAASQLYTRNFPLLHMSRYIISRDQFYQAFHRISTASDKCCGDKTWERG